MLFIFFDIKGMFTNNSNWQAKQPIPHGDCLKMCEDTDLTFGDTRTG
jgi:hypothetical protein